jgi:hypothetical protein
MRESNQNPAPNFSTKEYVTGTYLPEAIRKSFEEGAGPKNIVVKSRYALKKIPKNYYYSINSTGYPNNIAEQGSSFQHKETMIDNIIREIKADSLGRVTISDDGTYTIPEEDLLYFEQMWDRLGLLNDIENREDREILAYNLTIVSAYGYLENPKQYYSHVDVGMIALISLRKAEIREKISKPSLYWDFIISTIAEYYDHVKKIQERMPVDFDAEMCLLVSEQLKRVMSQDCAEDE